MKEFKDNTGLELRNTVYLPGCVHVTGLRLVLTARSQYWGAEHERAGTRAPLAFTLRFFSDKLVVWVRKRATVRVEGRHGLTNLSGIG